MDGSDGPITTDGSDGIGGSLVAVNHQEVISVQNHDAFGAQYLPDLGHEIKDFKVFTWRLSNWKNLDKKLTSPNFECGGRKWRILLHPRGTAGIAPRLGISLYLDSVDPGSPQDWHKCVQFALIMSNKYDPKIFKESHANHRFYVDEPDWGFSLFSPPAELLTNQQGHNRPIIEDDSVDITVYVRVLNDPTGVLWHNFVNYDSKKETGYVGLKNQGSTGYMNTVLQPLFHNSAFRKAVYDIPTQNDQPTESIALALQRIFYRLQTSGQAVQTTELTKSFGWKSLDSFLAHDALEFSRVLHDKLETIMKGTRSEGTIDRLFGGKMKSYIKCLNVNHEYSRVEEFSDLQLQVKGMQNITDSLRDFVSTDMLTGENKFMTDKFGFQDVKKGIIFQTFPLILHLQLKRFEYDVQGDRTVKVHDRFEYPLKLDLGEFVDDGDRRTSPWVYKLHAVMVHSGNLHGGQYYALVKPNSEARWLKFDDDRVTPVTDKEVFEDNYGGIQPVNARDKDWSTNAYILVYIRESAIGEVLAPVLEANIPRHIKQRLDEDRLQEEARKNTAQYLTVKVVTDETFARYEGFDLANFEGKNLPLSDLPTFQVLRTETCKALKTRVARHVNFPENQFRLWVMVGRQNKTIRVESCILANDIMLTVDTIRTNRSARSNDLRLFLETPIPSINEQPPQSILIFLKHFDAPKQTLFGAGHIYVSLKSTVGELIPLIRERISWSPSTPVVLYEEIKPGMIEKLKPNFTFLQSEFTDGDVICFQTYQENEIRDLESQGLCSNVVQYYDILHNRVRITFRPKIEELLLQLGGESEFTLILSRKQNYQSMSTKVGEHLQHDPVNLIFTTTNAVNGQPKAVLKPSLNQSIADIIGFDNATDNPPIILYEKLNTGLAPKHSVKVTWTGVHNREVGTYTFSLSKTNTLHDLEKHLRREVKLSREGTEKIRFFKISADGKAQTEFVGSTRVGGIPGPAEFYAEEIPREELEAKGSDKLVTVFHFSKETSRTHGVPFKFVAKLGEKFSDTKKRLQAQMVIPDAEIASYRFATQVPNFKQPLYLEDDDTLYNAQFIPLVLGLDHFDKPRAGA